MYVIHTSDLICCVVLSRKNKNPLVWRGNSETNMKKAGFRMKVSGSHAAVLFLHMLKF